MEIVGHEPTMAGGLAQNKDNEHQGAAVSIYDITDTCFDILERLVSASDASPPQPQPSASDTNLSNESSRDIRGLRNSFAFWVDYTGALAPIQASLDHKLKDHGQIKQMVVELLEMVERNLCRLEQNYKENPMFSDDASQRRLSAVDSALDRLNFLSRAIKKTSVRDQEQDLLNFTSYEDKLFRKVAISHVEWKHPNARSSLTEHMGDSIAAHRRDLISKYEHANNLKLRREPRQSYPQKIKQPDLTSVKTEQHKMLVPKAILHGQQSTVTDSKITQASKTDGKAASQIIYQEPTLSISSSGSFQSESFAQMEYPDPPRINPGEKHTRCPYCLEPLLEAELLGGSGDQYWVNHLNQDLHPYICLFPRCTNSKFASQCDWSNHMAASHSKDWPRKVHATIWYCNLDHDKPAEFDNEKDWRKHMLTPSLHRSRSKLPTDTQLDALAIRKQRLALRDPYTCPFCEGKPQAIEKLGDHENPSEIETILINHIAEHVKSLLLLALPPLDSETADEERKSVKSGNVSHKRLQNSNSPLRTPSGGSKMESISRTFDYNDGKPETEGDKKPALSSNLEAARKHEKESQGGDFRGVNDKKSSVLNEFIQDQRMEDVKEDIHGPKRYALLVGIDMYLNDGSRNASSHRELSLHHLRGCKNDIEAIHKFLRGEYQFENISTLTSSFSESSSQELVAVYPQEAPERWPTFANIKAEFDKIYDCAAAGDFFFFHYSGHGALLQRQNVPPKSNLLDPSLITVDFCCGRPAVRGWQLNQWLKKFNEKGIKVVVSLDSCYSGGSWQSTGDYKSFRTPDDWPAVPNLPIDYQAVADLDHTMELTYRNAELERSWSINPASFTLIAACGEEEKAAEKIVNGKIYGAFTWELLDCLRYSKDEDPGWKRGVNMTYRRIADQLNILLANQTPAAYGRDRLLFFGSYEPFFATSIIAQVQGNKVVIPAGKAHGINVGSEFMVFSEILVDVSFSVDDAEEFQCSVTVTDKLSLLLKQNHQAIMLSRYNLGDEETLRIYVDPAFGSSFRDELQRRLERRIVSPIEFLENTKDHLDVLSLDKRGEDDAIIRAPMWLTGSDDTVRPLNLRSSNLSALAGEAALALAHLARFRQILLLGEQRWPKPPFNVTIMAANGAVANPHPLSQKFRFTFENKTDEHLHITVIMFSPEFSIQQLYPDMDHSQTIRARQKKSFNFSMALPNGPEWVQNSLCRNFRRIVIRTLATRNRHVSWKILNLPNIWDANAAGLGKARSYSHYGSTMSRSDVDWWSHDEEIVTSSVE